MRRRRLIAALGLAALLAAPGAGAPSAPKKIAALDEQWRWVAKERFEVLTNGPERRARAVVEQLEAFRATISQLVGGQVFDPPTPIRVLLFARVWDMSPYQLLDAEGEPETFSGYFVSRGEVNYFALSGELDDFVPRIVLHEYAHLLIATQLGRPPDWLNEGLAEFLSAFRYVGRERRAEFGRPIAEHLQYLNSSSHFPLRQLIATRYDSPEFAHEVTRALFYAKSWLLVHDLQLGSEQRAGALARFVELSNRGTGAAAALEQAAGSTIAELDDELAAYQRKSLVPYRAIVLPEDPRKTPIEARPAAPGDAVYRLGEYLLALGPDRRAQAEAHFAAAGRPAPAPPRAGRGGHAREVGEIAGASPVDAGSLEDLRAAVAAEPDSAAARSRFAAKVWAETRSTNAPGAALLAEARAALL